MGTMTRWTVILIAGIMMLPAGAGAQDKAAPEKPAADKQPPAKDKPDDDKKPTPRTKAEKDKWVSAGELQGKLIRIESAQKTIALRQSFAYVPYRSRNLASKDVDVELQTADDLKIRLAYPPPATDDKGNPKRYTNKELRALKGSSKEWGYPGDFDSLKTDQIVRVYLKKPKDASRQSYGKPAAKNKDAVEENKPVVTTIYILSEPQK